MNSGQSSFPARTLRVNGREVNVRIVTLPAAVAAVLPPVRLTARDRANRDYVEQCGGFDSIDERVAMTQAPRNQWLVDAARRKAMPAPCDWRDCRLCMSVRAPVDLFERRAIKQGDLVLPEWAGEDVHAWHTDAELLAFSEREQERRAARDATPPARVRKGGAARTDARGRLLPTKPQPSTRTLERQMCDEIYPTTTDGCRAYELDGKCEHGHVTWLEYLAF